MTQPSLPEKIRRRVGDDQITRRDLYDLLIYHLKMRNWNDYPSIGWHPSPPVNNPDRILITELSSIGDVAITIPLIHSVSQRWHDAEVDFLCESGCSMSVIGHPEIAKLWELPVKKWRGWFDEGKAQKSKRELRDLVNEMKRRRYDYVINPHWNPFPALLNWFLDPEHVNGLTIDGHLNAFMVGNPTRKMELERMRTSHDVTVPLNPASAKRLNASVHEGETSFYCRNDSHQRDRINELFEGQTEPDRTHVLINTGSRMEERRWPAKHCANIIQHLDDALAVEFGLIGGPGDEDRLRRVIDLLPDDVTVVPWFEKTDGLIEDAYLADRSELTITTDSGPQHVISIRGNKVVTLAGDIWVGPWNTGSLVIRHQSGSVDSLRGDDVLSGVKSLQSETAVPKSDSNAQFYRSPLPPDDFWFRHGRRNEQSNADFRSWLSGLLSVQLWSYEAMASGWRGLEISRKGFHRLYELYWDGDFRVDNPEELSVIGSSSLSNDVLERAPDILERWSANG